MIIIGSDEDFLAEEKVNYWCYLYILASSIDFPTAMQKAAEFPVLIHFKEALKVLNNELSSELWLLIIHVTLKKYKLKPL